MSRFFYLHFLASKQQDEPLTMGVDIWRRVKSMGRMFEGRYHGCLPLRFWCIETRQMVLSCRSIEPTISLHWNDIMMLRVEENSTVTDIMAEWQYKVIPIVTTVVKIVIFCILRLPPPPSRIFCAEVSLWRYHSHISNYVCAKTIPWLGATS